MRLSEDNPSDPFDQWIIYIIKGEDKTFVLFSYRYLSNPLCNGMKIDGEELV